jgi:serine/threonine protein kinase
LLEDNAAGSAASAPPPADLVLDEFLARHQSPHGDRPSVAEYARRFPQRPDIARALRRRQLARGRFVLLHCCGVGAMGEVWEACDREAPDPVAIKMPRNDATDPAAVARHFADEARITATLDHRGIVTMRAVAPDDGAPFYVMRLVDGPMLGMRIREHHTPRADRNRTKIREQRRELLHSFRALCDAVAHAHARGVLHRDLTPANIIDEHPGRPVILDWGLARRMCPNGTVQDEPAGTPEYMAPEQVDGRSDPRSDVFGLGAILYEILAGHPPHGWPDGACPGDWRETVRRAEFARPHSARGPAPCTLSAIALKALARDPSRRYQDAASLGADITRWLAGEPITTPRDAFPWWRTIMRWRR